MSHILREGNPLGEGLFLSRNGYNGKAKRKPSPSGFEEITPV
jgi:hypothetical protein